MSTEPFIGEVKLFGFYFTPRYHAPCNGQLLSIAANTALFSLLGTTYGGNGQTTFGVPNMQGRMAIGQGSGAGLPSHSMGEMAGTTTTTLATSNLATHTHSLNSMRVKIQANPTLSDSNTSENAYPGTNNTTAVYSESAGVSQIMNAASVVVSGSTDPTGSNVPDHRTFANCA
jgi:microcystin-dependent protein